MPPLEDQKRRLAASRAAAAKRKQARYGAHNHPHHCSSAEQHLSSPTYSMSTLPWHSLSQPPTCMRGPSPLGEQFHLQQEQAGQQGAEEGGEHCVSPLPRFPEPCAGTGACQSSTCGHGCSEAGGLGDGSPQHRALSFEECCSPGIAYTNQVGALAACCVVKRFSPAVSLRLSSMWSLRPVCTLRLQAGMVD